MIRSRMTMRAVLEKNVATGADAYGNPPPPAWTAHATIACWAWVPRILDSARLREDGAKRARQKELRCAFPAGADVSESHRVARIEDRRGTVLFGGPLAIVTLERRARHLEARLERVE